MKRWLVVIAGVAVGVVVARRMSRVARNYPPSSLAAAGRDSAFGLLGTVKDFIVDIREGMAEREAEIQAAFDEGVALDDELHVPPSDEDSRDERDEHTTGAAHR